MEKFVITVLFKVKPGYLDAIKPLMFGNAQKSLTDEEGCLQFDVVQQQNDDHAFIFYEIYSDKTAFDFHLKTVHSITFNNKLKELGDNTTREPIRGQLISE
ncbi:MAG: putative quinol monooxygenase [Rhodospirillales bacterium]|jgi:autoinducer 2-degrading protein